MVLSKRIKRLRSELDCELETRGNTARAKKLAKQLDEALQKYNQREDRK